MKKTYSLIYFLQLITSLRINNTFKNVIVNTIIIERYLCNEKVFRGQ